MAKKKQTYKGKPANYYTSINPAWNHTDIVMEKHGRKYCAIFTMWAVDQGNGKKGVDIELTRWGDSEADVWQKLDKFFRE